MSLLDDIARALDDMTPRDWRIVLSIVVAVLAGLTPIGYWLAS